MSNFLSHAFILDLWGNIPPITNNAPKSKENRQIRHKSTQYEIRWGNSPPYN